MSTDEFQRIEHDDGVTVVEAETGLSGTGETYPEALERLVVRLRDRTDATEPLEETVAAIVEETDPEKTKEEIRKLRDTADFVELSREVQQRFAEENVTREDVEDAIEWARSR